MSRVEYGRLPPDPEIKYSGLPANPSADYNPRVMPLFTQAPKYDQSKYEQYLDPYTQPALVQEKICRQTTAGGHTILGAIAFIALFIVFAVYVSDDSFSAYSDKARFFMLCAAMLWVGVSFVEYREIKIDGPARYSSILQLSFSGTVFGLLIYSIGRSIAKQKGKFLSYESIKTVTGFDVDV